MRRVFTRSTSRHCLRISTKSLTGPVQAGFARSHGPVNSSVGRCKKTFVYGDGYGSGSHTRRSRYRALGDRAASPPWGHVNLHLADDSSSGSDDMGRSAGGWSFGVVVERLSSVRASLVLVRNPET